MIESVTMDRWKGQSCTRAVSTLNLLTGPNGSGKTATMEAIRWVVTGTSGMGRKADAAVAYGDGTGCSAAVTIDGVVYERKLKVDNRDGSIRQSLAISGKAGIGVREAEATIRDAAGDFMPMWDLGEFMVLSPDKRREFILNLCAKARPQQLSAKAIVDRLWTIAVADLMDTLNTESLTEQQATEVERQLRVLQDLLAAQVQSDLTVAIGSATTWARDCQNRHKAQADSASQAILRLKDRLSQIRVASLSVAELREALSRHLHDIAEISQRVGRLRGWADYRQAVDEGLKKVDEKLDRVNASIDEYRAGEAAATELMAKVVTLDQEAAELRRQYDESIAAIDDPVCDADARVEECQKRLDEAYTELRVISDKIADVELTISKADFQLKAIDSSPWARALVLVDQIVRCFEDMVCQSEPPALEELRALCAEHASAAGRNSIVAGKACDEATLAELVKSKSAILEGKMEPAKSALQAARLEIQQAFARNDEKRLAQRDLIDRSEEVEETANAARRELKDREVAISRLMKERESLSIQRSELVAQIESLETCNDDAESLARLLAESEESARTCREAIEAKERFAALDAELQAVVSGAERDRLSYEAMKSIAAAIKHIREELMGGLVAPLIQYIDTFCESSGKRAFCRLANTKGSPVLEFGLTDGERETPLEAMSGGESVLFGAALAYAMVQMSGVPLKVLMIEAAEVDHDVFSDLLNALERIRDSVSNVFVATCGYAIGSDNWNTISLWKSRPVIEMEVC